MKYQKIPDHPRELELVESAVPQDVETSPESSLPTNTKGSKFGALSIFVVSVVAVIGILGLTSINRANNLLTESASGEFDSRQRYIIRNYDLAKPMSNFLPGLAGIWGVPMWAFYVNRGQGITSFGKYSKDNAIAKFVTAEKAYQQTPFTGFRTFLKGKRGNEEFTHMPFFPRTSAADSESPDNLQRNMMVGSNDMGIEEISSPLALKTNVEYFIAPEQDFPALVRTVTFTNLDTSTDLQLEVLDGLGRLVPNGLNNYNVDSMGRTMEAWMNVYNVGSAQTVGATINQPFFHISQDTADNAQVRVIKDGYFAVAFVDNPLNGGVDASVADDSLAKARIGPDNLRKLLPFVVDPNVVYDLDTTLMYPSGFFEKGVSVDQLVTSPQGTTSRTPCAFAGATLTVPAGKAVSITSVFGYAEDLETLVGRYAPAVRQVEYVSSKHAAAQRVVDEISKKVETSTGSQVFDAYVKQDFLDNVLRGGLPIQLGFAGQEKIFHVYSRIHGDIERDYNYFVIDTTYFSQGPGNFRDVSQNRRVDVFHSPFVKDFNLRMFLSFVQADGYNPLSVASTVFKIPFDRLSAVVTSLQVVDADNSGASAAAVFDILRRSFRPGQFFRDCAALKIRFGIDREQVVDVLMNAAVQDFAAKYDQNGFWADHWTYTLDLLDNFVAIFPDEEKRVLFDAEPVPFYMSPACVRPRSARYSLQSLNNNANNNNNNVNNNNNGLSSVRSYHAVSAWGEPDFPVERVNAMNNIFTDPNYIVDINGAAGVWQRSKDNSVFKVSPIAKLLMLGCIKFASLDPMGMGVEMEGGKPGWNDAMNGLPGLLGSGMPETYEMLRILKYVLSALQRFSSPAPSLTGASAVSSISLPIEFVDFLTHIDYALSTYNASPKDTAAEFAYWDAANGAREVYRNSVVATFQGQTNAVSSVYLQTLLTRMIARVNIGVQKAMATSPIDGLSPTYFYFDCTDYSATSVSASPAMSAVTVVTPRSFQTRTLPLFLEGPTRHMKVLETVEQRRRVYRLVKSSPLYDAALQMYVICDSLSTMGQDVGRMKAFSAGWLENQSVWLHMSYKFYLELLRGGLYDEFFTEIKTGLVPFMDHVRYGRSPIEAASFIVSSAFPDRKLHGTSYLARLSGSTAEFLSMWTIMMAGHKPFITSADADAAAAAAAVAGVGGNGGAPSLALRPILPGWLFNADNEVSFTFLGYLRVTYVNPNRIDTWTATPQLVEIQFKNEDAPSTHNGFVLDATLSARVRNGEASFIRVHFA